MTDAQVLKYAGFMDHTVVILVSDPERRVAIETCDLDRNPTIYQRIGKKWIKKQSS